MNNEFVQAGDYITVFDATNLPSGIYTVLLVTDETKEAVKLLKQ